MAVLGTLLHLGMDFLNSYGVHPLWPWYNGWFYGDSIFIIEPLYWLATAPLIATVRSQTARILLILTTLAGLALALFFHPHQIFEAVSLVLISAALFFVGRVGTPRIAALASGVCAAAVTVFFVVEGRAAAGAATGVAHQALPGQRVLDHVLSPVPSNPFCWDMLLLTTDSGVYHATHGMLSTAPRFVAARDCPSMPSRTATTVAPQLRVDAPPSRDVYWLGQFSISEQQLRQVAMNSCETMELMQFVRAPFAAKLVGEWVLGDLRFDQGKKTGMAQVVAQPLAHGACADSAPWLPPREDLLK
jgi:inner membrane protein